VSTFLHVDMDAFFAAVEQRDRPELRGRPVVVGARPDQRGVVAAASYEAREYGIRSAMPSVEAGRLCPHAVFVAPDGKRYGEVSRHIMAIMRRYTPLVEPLSIDEAFLDVTGSQRLFGSGPEIGAKIKQRILQETGLTASVGVAPNKFLAKLASVMDKPDGLTVVPTGRERIVRFLAPLPVDRIWGVGKVTRRLLSDAGISTVGQLQAVREKQLAAVLGQHAARHLLRLAFGEDERDIETAREEKSLSHEYTFPRDCREPDTVRAVLLDLVDDVGRRLRRAGKHAGQARLKLRWQGFETLTRQRALDPPVCDDFSLRSAAESLLDATRLHRPVRLVGFGVGHLSSPSDEQLDLFDLAGPSREKRERLSEAVDAIRDRHGGGSIRRGSHRAAE